MDPRLRPYAQAALDYASRVGVGIRVTSVRRSIDEQQQLYNRYIDCRRRGVPTPPCAYPAARPGSSAHQYGLAWDSVVDVPSGANPEPWQAWWDAVRHYFGWEVVPTDRIHAQVPSWAAEQDEWRRWAAQTR